MYVNISSRNGVKSCDDPQWSPDGQWIAFVTARSGKKDIWIIKPDGGEAEQVTSARTGVISCISTSNSQPYDIAIGPDGNLWFTESNGSRIGMITTSGTITQYSTPTSNSSPLIIVAGPDGNLWFTESVGNKIGRITTSGTITEYNLTGGGSIPHDIIVGPDGNLWFTETGSNQIGTAVSGLPAATLTIEAAVQQTSDPQSALQIPLGETTVAPGAGTVSISQPLNFDLSSGTGPAEALVYSSADVDVKPIIQLAVATDPTRGTPSSIGLTLVWDPSGQDLTTTLAFTPTGSAGSTYLLAAQVSSEVTASGEYVWDVSTQINYTSGSPYDQSFTGQASVVNKDSSPLGAGFGLSGIDQILLSGGGALWMTGSGSSRFYQAAGETTAASTFVNDADFGTLIETGSGSSATLTYSAVGGTTETFTLAPSSTTLFDLASIVDTHGNSTNYGYDSSGRLTLVTNYDGTSVSLSYAGTTAVDIYEPGGSTVALALSGGNLTLLTDEDGNTRGLSYDGSHHLTQDQQNPLDTTIGYGAGGLVDEINLGAGITYTIDPQAGQGLTTATAQLVSADLATVTDAAGDDTTYQVDPVGVPTFEESPKGGTQTFDLNGNEQAIEYVDDNDLPTYYQFFGNNMTEEIDPDGSTELYSYNNLAEVTLEIDEPAGGRVATVTSIYNTAGDLTTQITDPGTSAAATTTNQYTTSGLLTETTDPVGNETTFGYNASMQMTSMIEYDAGATEINYANYTYDTSGNVADTITATGTTVDTYSKTGQLLTEAVYNNGSTTPIQYTSNTYLASGLLATTTDGDGNLTSETYNNLGLVTQTKVTDSGSNVVSSTSATYNDAGLVSSQIDGDGNTVLYGYDADYNVTSQDTYDSSGTLIYDMSSYFNAEDEMTKSIDGDGNTTLSGYSAGNLTSQALYTSGGSLVSSQAWGYDSHQNQTLAIDADGNTTTSLYNSVEQLTSQLVYDAGHTLKSSQAWLYDSSGDMTKTIDSDGNTTLSAYDGAGDVTALSIYDATPTLKSSETFAFDKDGDQTKMIDGDGNTILSDYDGGQLTEQITYNSGGSPLATQFWQYDLVGNQTLAIDADGNSTVSDFDAAGNMTEQILYNSGHTALSTQLWEFDKAGNQTLAIDADGNSVVSDYDGGQLTEQITYNSGGSPVATQFWQYDLAGNQTLAIDADGNSTDSIYDGGNLIEQKTYNNGATLVSDEKFGTDQAGNQTSVIDADGNTTLSSYDAMGDTTLVQVYNSLGTFFASEAMSYDASGNQTSLIDFVGNTTLTIYDDGMMTKQVVYDAGHSAQTASWGYDDAGNVTQFISFEGYTTLSTFDDGNLVSQTVNLGATQVDSETWGYDDNDNVTSHEDFDGNVTASTFNGLGLMSTQTITNGMTTLGSETWLYDANGNITDLIDVVGAQTRETKYYINGLGQTTEEIDGYGSAASATLQFGYDDNGNQTLEVDADGNSTQFAYNAMGLETWTENPNGFSETMQYDANGNMTSELDFDNRLQTFTYDAFGRETSDVWFSSSTTSSLVVDSLAFGYDANGNQTLASDDEGTYAMQYNPLGQITEVSEPFGASLNFSYDGAGNRTLVTDSFGGTQLSSYDADNQLVSEQYTGQSQTLDVSFVYDYLGEQTTEIMMYGGTTAVSTNVMSYDTNGNVTNVHDVTSASTTVNFNYTYDVANELTQEIDNGATTIGYTYGATGELTGAGTAGYAYDAGGNDGNVGDTVTTGNELVSDGTYDYGYDNAGNEISKTDIATSDAWAYSYNNANELTSAVETNASNQIENSVSYEYDAMGDKIEATTVEYTTAGYLPSATTTTTKYAIDNWNPGNPVGVASVWADLNSANGLQSRYVRTDDPTQILARIDNSGTPVAYWYLLDRQNSTRDIITNTAALKDTINYDAYGNIIWETNPTYGGDYKYTGEQTDSVTGLQYNNARWYDPNTGRWMSQDPMGFGAGDSNLYRYVNNSPMDGTDPSGEVLVQFRSQSWERAIYHTPKQDVFRTAIIRVSLLFDNVLKNGEFPFFLQYDVFPATDQKGAILADMRKDAFPLDYAIIQISSEIGGTKDLTERGKEEGKVEMRLARSVDAPGTYDKVNMGEFFRWTLPIGQTALKNDMTFSGVAGIYNWKDIDRLAKGLDRNPSAAKPQKVAQEKVIAPAEAIVQKIEWKITYNKQKNTIGGEIKLSETGWGRSEEQGEGLKTTTLPTDKALENWKKMNYLLPNEVLKPIASPQAQGTFPLREPLK